MKATKNDSVRIYREELKELNTPYTDEELEIHAEDREWKSTMETIHAHNWELIMLARAWTKYLKGEIPRPVKKICKYVNPSESSDINNACHFIAQLVELMCLYGEGNCPRARINTYASRSTATLIDKLSAIHHSEHLTRAECAANKLFRYATYQGEPTMSPEKFRATLEELSSTFVTECTANAEELAKFTAEMVTKIEGGYQGRIYRMNNQPVTCAQAQEMLTRERENIKRAIESEGIETRKTVTQTAEVTHLKQDVAQASIEQVQETADKINARDKRYRRKTKARFTIAQQDGIYAQWQIAKKDPAVQSLCEHKPGYEAALIQYRKEFNALGVSTVEELQSALKARLNRLRNHKATVI